MGQPSQTRLHAVPDLPHPGPQGASVCKHTHSEHSSNLTSRGVMWRLSLGICEKKNLLREYDQRSSGRPPLPSPSPSLLCLPFFRVILKNSEI